MMYVLRPTKELIDALSEQIQKGDYEPVTYRNWLYIHSSLDQNEVFGETQRRLFGSLEVGEHKLLKFMLSAEDLERLKA
ncbi:MAG: hypothetical protein KDN22_10060 [Verrucomicrobiae bacterium]|nr:hypothetical protein [Verrucomicrobiae bacterium]